MSNNILFILEGLKTEKSIIDNLTKFFVNENTIVTCAYCTTIYKMYSEISQDQFIDTFSLLKDIKENKETLKNFKRSDFSQIYMFFDYDGHVTNAGDNKLSELLKFFNEETEMGKLYISYPMVEALKHIESFDLSKSLKIPFSDFQNYKKIVSDNCIETIKHFHLYDSEIWKKVILFHLKKMNEIVHNIFELPSLIIDQFTIFNSQLDRHINIDKTVAILSAFPVFLLDYYGIEEIRKRLE